MYYVSRSARESTSDKKCTLCRVVLMKERVLMGTVLTRLSVNRDSAIRPFPP